MKKLLSYLLVIALVLVQFMPLVNAKSGKNSDDGSITITNAVTGQEYSIYQILELESYDTERKVYTYKATSSWKSFVESEEIDEIYLKTDDQGYVTWVEGANEKEFSRIALQYAKDNSDATQTKKASSNTVSFENLNLGYYLVDSSLGALCGLTTTQPSASVVEKNQIPSINKEVEETPNWGDENSAKIGDTVNYRTTIDLVKGAQNYVLKDTMTEGLTLNQDNIKVIVNGKEVEAATTTYALTTSAHGFEIKFDNDYIFSLVGDYNQNAQATSILVTYSAILNEKAIICDQTSCGANENSTSLKYGDNNETQKDITKTYSYEFNLVKVDGKNKQQLSGAEFTLWDAATDGNQIKVFKVTDGLYRVAYTEAELASATKIIVGNAVIEGLDENVDYYLQEEVAPNGYNKLASRVKVTLDGYETITTESTTNIIGTENNVTVENNSGLELPSTGGIGTVLFITVGSIMVLGFGVLLVTKLRLSKMDI